jgi:hypothetical protein
MTVLICFFVIMLILNPFKTRRIGHDISFADQHRFVADPASSFHFDADSDPTFHCDANPDPAFLLRGSGFSSN